MKTSNTKIKKNLCSYIREIVVQYQPLETEIITLNNPERVYEFIREKIGNQSNEYFVTLCVNNQNEIVSYALVSIGTVSEAIVHPREVFISAIMSKASGIIVAHNHPSGHMTPSSQDIETTKRLSEAGKIIGIPMIDHIIVGFNNNFEYYSMKENGYIV